MTSMANPYEPTIAGSPPSHEPAVAATPDAIPSHTDAIPQAQSPQSLSASTNDGPPPPQSDYPEQPYAQPTYPPSGLPPIPEQFGAPQQHKGRIGLWIALAFVAGLIVAGVVWGILYYVNRSTPSKTLQAFCTDFKTGDAQGFY